MSPLQKGGKPMNALEIIESYLKANGFDGLFNCEGKCACKLNDLAPCETVNRDCQPGYETPCDCQPPKCEFHIRATKP